MNFEQVSARPTTADLRATVQKILAKRRSLPPHRSMLVAVSGIDGSGKGTSRAALWLPSGGRASRRLRSTELWATAASSSTPRRGRKIGRGGLDGMKVDKAGNLFAVGPRGVFVLAPDGALLGIIETRRGHLELRLGWRWLRAVYHGKHNGLRHGPHHEGRWILGSRGSPFLPRFSALPRVTKRRTPRL